MFGGVPGRGFWAGRQHCQAVLLQAVHATGVLTAGLALPVFGKEADALVSCVLNYRVPMTVLGLLHV